MSLKLNAAGLTDAGRVRGNNEDAIFYIVASDANGVPVGLFVVADGVGGQLAGEQASQWAASTVRDSLRDLFAPPDKFQTRPLGPSRPAEAVAADETLPGKTFTMRERLAHAVKAANRAVYSNAQRHPEESGNASTTITAALVRGDQAWIANVGDSRTYLLRGKETRQITSDHSLIAGLVKSGNVKPEDLYTHPVRNVIVRSLGHEPDVEIDLFEEHLHPGDTLLLCSDGLWEMIRDNDKIGTMARRAPTPMDACLDLIKAANAAGGQDNISTIVVRVE